MGYEGLQPEDPQEIGPYRLLGQLGSGGLGRVFLGMSTGGRPIAVKVFREKLAADAGFRDRLRAEVDAARQVNGLYTALVVDADLDGPMPWLATAYVPGPSLAEAIGEHGPMPVETVLTLAAGLAESLSAIHAAGVIHRDLQPANVLLSKDGPRVIDFGISQAAEAAAPAEEDLGIGSPGYMAPEQILDVAAGPASDIFSLGAVLTFAATGEGPFGSASRGELLDRVVKLPPDLGSLPDALRPLVKACLAKDPRRRPTAQDLLDKVGAMQPEPGWIAESLFTGFAPGEDTLAFGALAIPSIPADADAGAGAAVGAGLLAAPVLELTEPGLVKHPGKRRRRRSMVPAYVSGGLVVASAVAVLALTKPGSTPEGSHAQPQAAASALVVAPAGSAIANVPSAAATPAHKAPAKKPTPNVYVTPADDQVITPSVLSATAPATATAKPATKTTKAPVKSASPAPSKSATKSATPTPTPTPTVSTTTPTPTPTPTVTTSAPTTPPATPTSSAPTSSAPTSAPASTPATGSTSTGA